MIERGGLPHVVRLSGPTRHDIAVLEVIDAVRPIRQLNRLKRPDKLHADKAYDIPRFRQALTRRRIKVPIAREGVDSSQRLNWHSRVVERTVARLNQFHRPIMRCERRIDLDLAFLSLGCA